MNIIKPVLRASVFSLLIASCSSNDDANNNQNQNSGNHFPFTIGNYWNYDISNSNINTGETQLRRDSLYVATNNANTVNLAINGIANGTMNSILTQTSLSKSSSKLFASGTVIFPFEGLDDLEIAINDAIFYDLNAAPNTLLSDTEGSIVQTVENLPITTTYVFKTTQGPFSVSLPLNGETYSNVTKSTIELQLTRVTQVEIIPGNVVDVVILDTQNVLKIDNYYAENIGLVRSEANISYVLEDFSQIGITLPFPVSLEATSLQRLYNYEVLEE